MNPSFVIRGKALIVQAIIATLVVTACSSAPTKKAPDWIQQPTRTVDNGYIVYVGSMGAATSEKAQFKAEGQALEDLANECSMIPTGTRIEDRYTETEKYGVTAFVKVGLEFQLCERAKKTLQPADIKQLASLQFTEQLKRYQDLVETGEMADQREDVEIQPPEQLQPAPDSNGMTASTHFIVLRQYVAYQKQIVVLSPPTAYASTSKESQNFATAVQPSTQKLAQLEEQNPTFKSNPTPWSRLQDRPKMARPESLVRHPPERRSLKAPIPVQMGPSHMGKHGARGGKGFGHPRGRGQHRGDNRQEPGK